MTVDMELREIETTIEETLDVARRRKEKKTAKSRLEVYRKALEEVRRIAGESSMEELGEWIRKEIREAESPPSGRAVRKEGATICRDNGEEISTGSWLGT